MTTDTSQQQQQQNRTLSVVPDDLQHDFPSEKRPETGLSSNVVITVAHSSDHEDKNSACDAHENQSESMRNPKEKWKRCHVYASLQSLLSGSSSSGRWATLVMTYQTMGVVYAGIGTCPLYVFSSFTLNAPTGEDYLGVFSIVFWTLTLISLVKYGLIVLYADDHGEGGTFALYSLLCQYVDISHLGGTSKKIEGTTKPKPGSNQSKMIEFLEHSKTARTLLFIATMMGACMLIGDGILTPAISVLSAVEGLKTASSSLNQSDIVKITAALLIVLFLLQRFGTSRVSFLFSPIVVAWFVATPLVGAYNIAVHYPSVFKAISPTYLFTFFLRRGKDGWKVLAGTVLCVTGSEAMYADLGHFNRLSMQLAFAFFAYPSNVITYAGQAAYLIKHPETNADIFYNFIPRPVFWPMFAIATLAAIVASQCLISACFSLVKQSVALEMFPKVRLIHTSDRHEGQVYSPEVNYFLMVLCILVVIGFRDSIALGNAYGVAVIMVMLITTCFVSLVMVVVWDKALALVLTFLVTFTIIEGIYVSAVLSKVPQGGWLPFLVAILLGMIMYSWTYGRQKHHAYEKANTTSIDDVGGLLATYNIKRVPGLCVFYCDLEDDVPPLIRHYLRNVRSLHRTIVFLSLKYAKMPKVPEAERFKISTCGGYTGLYKCVALYGYGENKNAASSGFWENLVDSVKRHIETCINSHKEECPFEANFVEVIEDVESARKEGPVLVVGKTRLTTKKAGLRNWFRKLVLHFVYQFLNSNSSSIAASLILTVPASNLMEISMLYEV